MRRPPVVSALLGVVLPALCACSMSGPADPLLKPGALGPESLDGQLFHSDATEPPSRKPGECWADAVTPAVFETDTSHELIRPAVPARPGHAAEPAEYRTVMRQKIVQERAQVWFRTPCPVVMTPDFIGSLQRALLARGYYRGALTGEMDTRTKAALQRYQAQIGLDSPILALGTARLLGLVSYDPTPASDGRPAGGDG